jgi:hypothetical protein
MRMIVDKHRLGGALRNYLRSLRAYRWINFSKTLKHSQQTFQSLLLTLVLDKKL